jgi:hypothetical protein
MMPEMKSVSAYAKELRKSGYRPVIVGPEKFSLEDLLRYVDPAPDAETERFVEEIYEDRRKSAAPRTRK